MKILVYALCLTFSLTIFAHNNFYLPGDSLFSGSIKSYDEKDKKLTLSFDRMTLSTMACGYMGYDLLIINNIEKKEVDVLKTLLKDQRKIKNPGKQEIENITKKALIFIYNKDFDTTKPLGLRYNENWAKFQKKHSRHALYPGVTDYGAPTKDWEHADSIAPLKVNPFKFTNNKMGESTPLTIDRKDIKLLIIPPCALVSLIYKMDDMYFYEISKTIEKCVYKNIEITRTEVKIKK